ncbi:MAG: pyridoxal phosphate-dependent decarboxylase family protein [Steroidobacteraceae bacterium]
MRVWDLVGREADDFMGNIRALPVSAPMTPAEVRQAVESQFTFAEAMPLAELTQRVAHLLRKYTIHVTHPCYFGLFNPSVPVASIVADTLVALFNPQLGTWSHSPAANELERVTLRYFARALGLDPDGSYANFTTGGLEANMSAVLVALAHRFPDHQRGGVAAIKTKPMIYVTSESHHSFVKICRNTGLGLDALCEVPTSATLAMDPQALREMIRRDERSGRCPFLIVATAGTTGGGIVDPITELADTAAESGAWLHVDAAWGGAAVLVPRLRPLLRGIERADSITWDAHKWLSVPMGAGMFFCRHVDAVHRAFDVSASYMPSSPEATFDQYHMTLQWSRRAIGLKVLMAVAERGHAGLIEQIDRQARMGDALRARLMGAGWIVVNDTALPLICTTHEAIRAGKCSTSDIVRSIQGRGRVWLSDVVLGRRERVLRACITSFRTEEGDLDLLMSELADTLSRLTESN